MDPNTSIPQGENNSPQPIEQTPQNLGVEPVAPKETFVPPVQIQDNSDVPSTPVAPQTPITPNSPEPAKKNSPILIVAIILMLIAVLAAGGYLLWLKYFSGSGTTPTPTPIAIVTASPTPDPTANWKTYSDDLHDITFKYPTSWTLTETKGQSEKETVYNSLVELGKADAKINMIFNVDGIGGMPTTYEGNPFTLDGHNLFQFSGYNTSNASKIVGISDSLTTLGVFRINNIAYLIHLTYPATYKEIEEKSLLQEFDQILSTFKFIETTPTATSVSSPSATAKP